MRRPEIVVTRQEFDNALEAHEIVATIAEELSSHSSATTLAIETELVLRIRLCAAFRRRILMRQNANDNSDRE